MLSDAEVSNLLVPFGLRLNSVQTAQLLTYLELLLKWNRKINLTAIRSPEDCVTRHFGESLYVTRSVALQGTLLDIGSGAGFPGLPLKVIFPNLRVTLLEPVAKKRAFLKEVIDACRMDSVEVRGERLEDFVRQDPKSVFGNATSRAVGNLEQIVALAATCLEPGGRFYLWITRDQRRKLTDPQSPLDWGAPIALPQARQREIWIGARPASTV